MDREKELAGRIRISPAEKVTPQEIERRRKVVAATLKLREEIGPIGISVAELIRKLRQPHPLGV